MPISPSSNTTFASTDLDVVVSTNNSTGYTLTVNNDSTDLVSSSATIPSIEQEITKTTDADFPLNHWGLSLDGGTTYKPITTTSFILKTTEVGANNDTTTLNLATRVDLAKPAGAYSNTFAFTAVANYVPIKTLSQIDNMQDMTPEICTNSYIEESNELLDIRDGKWYQIAKLADENCWMTQNLALGYPYEDVGYTEDYEFPYLTPDDSDVTEDFNFYNYADESYMHYVNDESGWNSEQDMPEYAHWDNMDDAMRYGNYYNYALATAYSSNDIDEGVAPSSICPKGWRLPTASDDGDGEFSMLLNEYGWDFANPPLSFGFAGVYPDGWLGNIGVWWSSYFNYSDSDYYATTLYVDSTGGVQLMTSISYYGHSIRCIARKTTSTWPTITYDANGGTGAPSPTSGSSFELTLSSTVPTKSGFTFAGWNTKQDGSGSWYQPSDTITTASDITLYAIWWTETTTFDSAFAAAGKSKQDGYYKMQDMDSSICNAVTSAKGLAASSTQLIDTRDNKIYWISKLADGHCWMLDNLALDLTNSTVKTNLTSSTTNASDTTLNYLKNGGGTTSDKYATAGVANWTSSNSYSAPLINSASKDEVYGAPADGKGFNKVGVYYNYCAASAGSYCYGSGTSYGTSSGNASEDICPKGWRMPTGGPDGEYAALYYSSNYTNFRNALSLPLSGVFSVVAIGQGSDGHFWSSTRGGSSDTRGLGADTSNIYLAVGLNRSSGYSVRCVAGS